VPATGSECCAQHASQIEALRWSAERSESRGHQTRIRAAHRCGSGEERGRRGWDRKALGLDVVVRIPRIGERLAPRLARRFGKAQSLLFSNPCGSPPVPYVAAKGTPSISVANPKAALRAARTRKTGSDGRHRQGTVTRGPRGAGCPAGPRNPYGRLATRRNVMGASHKPRSTKLHPFGSEKTMLPRPMLPQLLQAGRTITAMLFLHIPLMLRSRRNLLCRTASCSFISASFVPGCRSLLDLICGANRDSSGAHSGYHHGLNVGDCPIQVHAASAERTVGNTSICILQCSCDVRFLKC
jgi:hypothetical protein